jgi:NADH-quinone oxidoreductase subunit G
MTAVVSEAAGTAAVPDGVTVTIDGFQVTVPKGTLIIRAAELLGIQIPRFCDHPLLDPIGACRQCLVQVEGQPKPPASCITACTDGMVVHTQLTSPVAEKAQRGTMELLLINHPLDCPMCDKGGECPLQNQAMSNGQGETRFADQKRRFAKPVAISSQVLLDRERCISCTRCVRFSEEIAGEEFIEFFERGPQQYIATAEGKPFNSYFSGNTIQICPVGALTSASYRFRSRPFDLVSTPSICEHCASGCRQRTDHRRGAVMRRLAGHDPAVNEEWNCDKGRFAFRYATQPDRLISPLVRDDDGALRPASWPEALAAAASGLLAARGRAGVLAGGRLTAEDAYGYAKFARVALASNDVDMRVRPHSAEETQFLADRVAGRPAQVSYAGLEGADAVLLAGFEPEDESPIVFLRLRKAARKRGLRVYSVAALAGPGLGRMYGTLLPTVPGSEAAALDRLASGADAAGQGDPGSGASGAAGPAWRDAAAALRRPGAVILAGERLAEVPGALSAAARLAETTGARLAWIPRRAGERGAIEAGALPILLPGGRAVADAVARADVARAWGVASLPADPGRDTTQILAAAAAGEISALVVGGADPADLPDPAAALGALEACEFVVSLELRASAVTDRADVVFPVAAVAEKAGTFLNWEGRPGSFAPALPVPGVRSDLEVLTAIAGEMDVHLGLPDVLTARRELAALAPLTASHDGGTAGGSRTAGGSQTASGRQMTGHAPAAAGAPPAMPAAGIYQLGRPHPGAGQAVLATWHNLLDAGRLSDGEPHLAGTARPAAARMSAATAAEAGVSAGGRVSVSTRAGSVTVPVEIADMPDRVVWLPANSAGCAVRGSLAAGHGAIVTIRKAPEGHPPEPAPRDAWGGRPPGATQRSAE